MTKAPRAAHDIIVTAVVLTQIGQIMYTIPLPWKTDESVAGIMLAPVLFAMLTLMSAVILLALYLTLQVTHNACVTVHCSPFSMLAFFSLVRGPCQQLQTAQCLECSSALPLGRKVRAIVMKNPL